MTVEELVQVNVYGDTKPLIQLDPNWRDDFNEYQSGYECAPNKLDYNRQILRKMHERYFPHEKPSS